MSGGMFELRFERAVSHRCGRPSRRGARRLPLATSQLESPDARTHSLDLRVDCLGRGNPSLELTSAGSFNWDTRFVTHLCANLGFAESRAS